jgi:hypothetical protein
MRFLLAPLDVTGATAQSAGKVLSIHGSYNAAQAAQQAHRDLCYQCGMKIPTRIAGIRNAIQLGDVVSLTDLTDVSS